MISKYSSIYSVILKKRVIFSVQEQINKYTLKSVRTVVDAGGGGGLNVRGH